MPKSKDIATIRYWHEPRLEILLIGENPPRVSLMDRTLRFTLTDNDNNYDTIEWELDNSDGILTRPENLALGLFAEVRYGYPNESRPWMRYVINRIQGGVGAGSRQHPVAEDDRQITYYGRNRNAPDLKGRAVQRLYRETLKTIKGQKRFRGGPTPDLAKPDMINRVGNTSAFKDHPRVVYGNTTSDIIREIARRNGFDDAHQYIEETPDRITEGYRVIPPGVSDAAFCATMALSNQWIFRIDINGFHFHSRHWEGARPTTHYFRYGESADVLGLQIDGDFTLPQPEKIRVAGYNPVIRAGVFADVNANDVNVSTPLRTIFAETERPRKAKNKHQRAAVLYDNETVPISNPVESARRKAIQRFLTRTLSAYKLVLTVVGNPTVQAGHYVNIRGTSSPLADGTWYAYVVKHIFDGTTYQTEITLGVPPRRRPKKTKGKVLAGTFADPDNPNSKTGITTFTNRRMFFAELSPEDIAALAKKPSSISSKK